MEIPCPHCGNKSHQFGQKYHTMDSAEFAFQCLGQSCRKTFTGVMTLSRGAPVNVERFSDRHGLPLAVENSTDC